MIAVEIDHTEELRNLHNSLIVVGLGKLVMASILCFGGLMPLDDTVYPRNWTSDMAGLIVMPFSSNLWSTM